MAFADAIKHKRAPPPLAPHFAVWGETVCLRFICSKFDVKAGHFYGQLDSTRAMLQGDALSSLSSRTLQGTAGDGVAIGAAVARARYVSDIALSLRSELIEKTIVQWVVGPLLHTDGVRRAAHIAALKGRRNEAAKERGGNHSCIKLSYDPHSLGHIAVKREAKIIGVITREIFPALDALLSRGSGTVAGAAGASDRGESKGNRTTMESPRFMNGDFPGIAGSCALTGRRTNESVDSDTQPSS